MKNFTNNFKQFTSRLSARWLIMALMMLVGTSSAWAANKYTNNYIFLDLSGFTGWADGGAVLKVGMCNWDNLGNGHQMSTFVMTKVPGENYIYYADISSSLSTDRYGVKFSRHSSDGTEWDSFFSAYNSGNCGKPNGWKSGTINNLQDVYCISAPTFGEVEVGQSATSSGTYLYAGVSTIPEISNNSTEFQYVAGSSSITTNGLSTITVKFTPSSAGDKTGTLKFGSYLTTSLSGKGKVSCTPETSITSAKLQDGTISLAGNFTTCGAKYHGFQWRKVGSNWCGETDYENNKESNYVVLGSSNVNGSKTGSFTPKDGGTYEFRTYIATTSPWLYSSETIEVSTCVSVVEPAVAMSPADGKVCQGSPVELTLTTRQSGVMYKIGNEEIFENTTTYSFVPETNRVTVTASSENACAGTNNKTKEFSISIKSLPEAPTFGNNNSMTVCEGVAFTLPKPTNLKEGTEECIWSVGGETTTDNQQGISQRTVYTAVKNDGCSSSAVEFTVNVNPLPNITISGSEKAVPYEDVTLTATANQGATVKWYEGGEEKATGTTYVVTSSIDASKTVTAKAFLNGCESDEVSHTIKFSDEVCKEGTKDEEVIVEKTKILCKRTNSGDVYCYIWGNVGGKEVNNAAFPGVKMTEVEDGYKKIEFDNKYDNGKFNIIFNNGLSGNNNQTGDKKDLLESYIHKFTYNGGNTANYESGYPKQYIETIKVPTPAPITAPGVKMVSAEYNENTDKIDVVAAVYKRGCANVEWGFQYSEDGTTWSNKIYPNSHTATAVGEVTHSFSIDGGEGNTYYIRAYAKNSNSEVTSANTKSVEIPSKTIESATIALVEPSTDTEVCPQSTVYLKVSYVGGDFKDYEAAENFPGTNLELVNHDKVNNYAIFSYIATTTGVANITISNENTSVTPETGVNIAVKEVSVVTPPTIYLEKNIICETQTTNVVVNSPIVGLSYSLKNGSVGDPVTYESGDLKFPVSVAGSYTVQVQETVCGTTAISAPVDLRVITSDVKITLTTDVNEISPWQPLTLTVKAPSGYDYDLQGLDGTVYTKSGDVYTIKFPRPASWGVGNSASKNKPETKTFTAGIKAGEEPSCSTTTKEIQLVDTEEECLAVGN